MNIGYDSDLVMCSRLIDSVDHDFQNIKERHFLESGCGCGQSQSGSNKNETEEAHRCGQDNNHWKKYFYLWFSWPWLPHCSIKLHIKNLNLLLSVYDVSVDETFTVVQTEQSCT